MANETGTKWRDAFQALVRQVSEDTAAAKAQATHFVPRCLDCDYDLTGLDDGRCSECGHWFTHEHLFAAYTYRQQVRAKRFSRIRHIPLAVAYVPFLFAPGTESYVGFGAFSAMLAVGALSWFLFNRGKFIEGSHWLLVLIPPLLSMFIGVTTVENGRYGMAGVAVTIVAVCFLALRGSPLLGSLILGGGGIVPFFLFSMWLLTDSLVAQRRNHYWSSFDYPAFPRWRAFTAVQAQQAGYFLVVLVAVLAICMVLVAKRSTVRLRRLRNERAQKST